MVRVRHPGMQTSAGATAASGLDLIVTPNSAVHALVEFSTVEEAATAVALLNNDRDWRNGLRVRLLVRPGAKKNNNNNSNKQQQPGGGEGAVGAAGGHESGTGEEDITASAVRAGAGPGACSGEGGEEGTAGGEDGTEGPGVSAGAAPAAAKKKSKTKYGKPKRDYSQWASAAAYKENKAFLEGGDGGVGDGGGGGGGMGGGGGGVGAKTGTVAANADPTMPDGTRGFHPGAGRGRRMPPPTPQ